MEDDVKNCCVPLVNILLSCTNGMSFEREYEGPDTDDRSTGAVFQRKYC